MHNSCLWPLNCLQHYSLNSKLLWCLLRSQGFIHGASLQSEPIASYLIAPWSSHWDLLVSERILRDAIVNFPASLLPFLAPHIPITENNSVCITRTQRILVEWTNRCINLLSRWWYDGYFKTSPQASLSLCGLRKDLNPPAIDRVTLPDCASVCITPSWDMIWMNGSWLEKELKVEWSCLLLSMKQKQNHKCREQTGGCQWGERWERDGLGVWDQQMETIPSY